MGDGGQPQPIRVRQLPVVPDSGRSEVLHRDYGVPCVHYNGTGQPYAQRLMKDLFYGLRDDLPGYVPLVSMIFISRILKYGETSSPGSDMQLNP